MIIPGGRNEVGSGWTHISRVLEDKCLCFSIELIVCFFSVFGFGISVMFPIILSLERWRDGGGFGMLK